MGPVLLVISWATLWAASRGGPPPRPEQLALVWTPAFYRRESAALRGTPRWANYRWLSAVLLALTLGLVALFA